MLTLMCTGFICYDDSCHLKKYACNPIRRSCTLTSERLASLYFVIDKFHFKGHIDPWCHQHCNPYLFPDLKEVYTHALKEHSYGAGFSLVNFYYCVQVDTETCEQLFSWLSRYSRITRHMNREHFLFYMLYLCDSHNRKHARKESRP